MSNQPYKGQVYTVREIQSLDLRDNAFLRFKTPEAYGGHYVPMQDDGITEELLTVIGELRFEYIRTTSEWIPLFNCVSSPEEVAAAIDFELSLNPYGDGLGCWVTAKGHYVEQDYTWQGDGLIASYMDEAEPAPQHLIDFRNRHAV